MLWELYRPCTHGLTSSLNPEEEEAEVGTLLFLKPQAILYSLSDLAALLKTSQSSCPVLAWYHRNKCLQTGCGLGSAG